MLTGLPSSFEVILLHALNSLIGLGISGFVIACLICRSVIRDDSKAAIAPRPMFLANLLSIALLVIIAMRFGEWLGFKITEEEFKNVPKSVSR